MRTARFMLYLIAISFFPAEWDYNYFGNEDEDRNIGEEHRRRVLLQVDVRRIIRDAVDPFAVSVPLFMLKFRLPQHLVFELVHILAPYMGIRAHPSQIPVHLRVCYLSKFNYCIIVFLCYYYFFIDRSCVLWDFLPKVHTNHPFQPQPMCVCLRLQWAGAYLRW